ncbi:hypothetical protein PTT_18905 [Pyrenophora teres f. teres 0-1]|uniref:Uncharacterized protein n=1 Tax=Pyrenophora teres f. teres (strain 0-1) TaxID=861557 RepID=E3S7S4_PYRTT|nr:hypothetical protein PTT_18905 [Pyrenophora teres f. teres 0-1]
MPLRNLKRVAKGTYSPFKRAKTAKDSASQPILIDDSQPKLSIRTLLRKALATISCYRGYK